MELNKSTRYALYSLIEMARRPGEPVSAAEVASGYAVSEHHVAKVLQRLGQARLIHSIRGAGGGYVLNHDPRELTMFDIVELFEPQANQQSQASDSTPRVGAARVQEVMDEIYLHALSTFKSIRISTLSKTGPVTQKG